MLQKIKNLPLNIPAILICLAAVFIFAVFIKANSGAKIQFTSDTIVSLTGITDGDLYIANNSECDSLSVSGSTLTVNDIPAGSYFILKTSQHNNALKITPSGGVLDLTFNSAHLSLGRITRWTLEGSNPAQAIHIVGTPEASKWYAVKINGVLLNNYQSNSSNEISFTYSGGWSSKVFTIEEGSAPGGGLPPAAYNPPVQPEPTPENPENKFSVLINNGDEYTNNKTITLKLNAGSDTTRMAISNTEDFENASQVLYHEEIEWDLLGNPPSPLLQRGNSQEGNTCVVYAKFYTQYGVASEVVSDSIIYTAKSDSNIPDGSLIRAINDYKVYITKGNYKRHILDGEIFDFYGHLGWDNIVEINPSQLNNYQESYLIREVNDHRVYKIIDNKKHWLNITVEEFENLGYNWDKVYVVNEEELGWYEIEN